MNRARRTLPPVVTVPAVSIGASTWKARPSASAPSTIVPKKKRAERKRAKAMHEWQSGAHQPEGAAGGVTGGALDAVETEDESLDGGGGPVVAAIERMDSTLRIEFCQS